MKLMNPEISTTIIQVQDRELPEVFGETMIHQSDFYKGLVTLSDYFEDPEQRPVIESALVAGEILYELVEYITFGRKAYRIFVPLEKLQEARELSTAAESGKPLPLLPLCVLTDRAYWFCEFIAPTQVATS